MPAESPSFVWKALCVVLLPLAVSVAWSQKPAPVSTLAGHSMQDLQLCGDTDRALEILREWDKDKMSKAIENLGQDRWFIGWYSGLGIALIAFSCYCLASKERLRDGLGLVVLSLVTSLLGAEADYFGENALLLDIINAAKGISSGAAPPHIANQVDGVRSFAMAKFTLLAIGWSSTVALYLAGCRVWLWWRKPSADAKKLLKATLESEYDELPKAGARCREHAQRESKFDVQSSHSEPFVSQTPRDLFGLALSGGGIRSATFGLGVLMRLREFGVLRHVDYLSTVSGGGYIGGWLTRRRKVDASILSSGKSTPTPSPELPSIRHLRLFSNFLVPRSGLLQPEMWLAVAAVLSSLLPALLVGVAVVLGIQIAWLLTLYATNGPAFEPHVAARVAAGIGLVVTGWCTFRATRNRDQVPWEFGVLLGLLVCGCTYWCHWALRDDAAKTGDGARSHAANSEQRSAWRRWASLVGYRFMRTEPTSPASLTAEVGTKGPVELKLSYSISASPPTTAGFPVSWRVAALGLALFGAAIPLIGLRMLLISMCDSTLSNKEGLYAAECLRLLDAVLGGIFWFATLWCGAALLWSVGVAINRWNEQAWCLPFAGSVSAASAFAWLRDRLRGMLRAEQSGGRWESLQAYVPMLLAYVALVLFYVAVAAWLVSQGDANSPKWVGLMFFACLTLAIASSLPPERFGLHEFYRSRLARAFLGGGLADSASIGQPRTDEQAQDDLPCSELPGGGPIHLICCAANDVAGDSLRNLNRGARSATISKRGLSIGGQTSEVPNLRYSSALTASAAAFNSQMGGMSVAFGPAVAFLMCALNLRLGLWLPHPEAPGETDSLLPGSLRFKEMFNLTHAYADRSPYVHLSDGGHFENLALYELVRRRCRYIIVSDAGADPNVKFEDFGNAVRRIREDFGADIEIDLEPLRPNAQGLSRQHVAVGTIRYDAGGRDFDVGVLVYLKPALTGDEAVDIANYKSLNPSFPHETTVDQFYDEAQWESYRSLGSHAAFQAFSFLDGQELNDGQRNRIPSVFSQSRQKWYPTPAGFDARMVDLNGRFVALEQRFAREASDEFMREVYPEFSKVERRPIVSGPPSPAESGRQVHLILEMLQLIEDVWLLGDFEKNYNHPLMQGWINAFHRWTNVSLVRRWWPFLIPLFTPGMKRFAEEHFGVPRAWTPDSDSSHGIRTIVRPSPAFPLPPNLLPQKSPGAELFYIHIAVPEEQGEEVPIGWINVKFVERSGGRVATWLSSHFRMRPGMWSSGFGGSFLRQFIKSGKLDERHRRVVALEVRIDLQDGTTYAGRGTGHRRERNDLVMFYKALGFETTDADDKWITMCRPTARTPAAPKSPR